MSNDSTGASTPPKSPAVFRTLDMGNPRCPICGLYELNDGSEEALWTCECDEEDDGAQWTAEEES